MEEGRRLKLVLQSHSTPTNSVSSVFSLSPAGIVIEASHIHYLPHIRPTPHKKINKMEDERGKIQSWYNYPISISSHPSFLPLHSSFSPSQLSLPLSPARPPLPPLCSCLFRLGWDKWERMNTLGTQGSRRAECGGQGEARGGGGVTWTRRDWPVRKIKPSRWWRVMNGSHYEWFGERGAGGEEVWKGGQQWWDGRRRTNDVGRFL